MKNVALSKQGVKMENQQPGAPVESSRRAGAKAWHRSSKLSLPSSILDFVDISATPLPGINCALAP